jgi:endonuclease/exonuclease/phosphatase (EEP) superfamily protein YafD
VPDAAGWCNGFSVGASYVEKVKLRWLLLGLVVVLLIVPAAVLTVARVGQPPGGVWVRLVAFTPYAFVLYAAVLVLLLVAWSRGRGRWRTVASTGALVALAGVVMHGFWLAPAYVGSAGPAPGGEPLRVMTANLMLGQAAASQVVELVVREDVDVLVLQEVDDRSLARLRAAGLDDAFAHSAGEPAAGAAGTMVLARRPIRDVDALGTGLGGYQVAVGGVTLLAVHPRPPTGDVRGWVQDHRTIRRAAYERAAPTMIVGDLNATIDHRVVRELIGQGYRDAATAAGSRWQPTWPADGEVRLFGVPVPPMLALDHVLVNDALQPVRTESIRVDGTDHRALLAEVVPS